VLVIENPGGGEITAQTTKFTGESLELTFKLEATDEDIRVAVWSELFKKYPEMTGSMSLHTASKGKKLIPIEGVMGKIGKSKLYVVLNGSFTNVPGLPVNVDDGGLQVYEETVGKTFQVPDQVPLIFSGKEKLDQMIGLVLDHLNHMVTVLPAVQSVLDVHIQRLDAVRNVSPSEMFPQLANTVIDTCTSILSVCTKFHCRLLTADDLGAASLQWQAALQNYFMDELAVKVEPDQMAQVSDEAGMENLFGDVIHQRGEDMDCEESVAGEKQSKLPDLSSLLAMETPEHNVTLGFEKGSSQLLGIDDNDMSFLEGLGIDTTVLSENLPNDFGCDLKADDKLPDKMFA